MNDANANPSITYALLYADKVLLGQAVCYL